MRAKASDAKLAAAIILLVLIPQARGGIADTPHNLSISGPGPIKSPTETQICIFCHTPHNANPDAPLWNHSLSAVAHYEMPWSSTMQAYPSAAAAPQPDGASKLCLSCHDGTIALGAVRSRTGAIPVSGGPALAPGTKGYLGTDLSGSHPISFVYSDTLAIQNNAAGNMPLRMPSSLTDKQVKLDSRSKIQCTTCHDPHNDSNYAAGGVPHFYVKSSWSAVCTTCHDF
jgi:hypothetical protein